MQVSLVSTPVWTPWTPPLTIASLTAFLAQREYGLRQYDWNIELLTGIKLSEDGINEHIEGKE